MKYQLSFIFLISIYPILVEGNTNKAPESSQQNTTKKTKTLPVSESISLKEKLSKNKKEENKTLIVSTAK